MRHGNKINALGRTRPHRKALLKNLANSLIMHKRINTTLAKAKELRKYIEPLLTRSKTDSTHSRRTVFSSLQNKFAVTELFREVAPKIANRPGGYTRILKTGNRPGDAAEMCFIELVDFNLTYIGVEKKAQESKPKTRRGRQKPSGPHSTVGMSENVQGKKVPAESQPKVEAKEEQKVVTPKHEEKKSE